MLKIDQSISDLLVFDLNINQSQITSNVRSLAKPKQSKLALWEPWRELLGRVKDSEVSEQRQDHTAAVDFYAIEAFLPRT